MNLWFKWINSFALISMCGVMLALIIFVLELFKFPVTLNSFTRFPSYTNFIFATVSYRWSSSCYCPLAAAGSCCCFLASSSTFVAVGFCCCSSASFPPMFFNPSPVHIPCSPSSRYTKKKQFHVQSAAFLQVHLMLLAWVLIQRCIILKLYFFC